jgi:predicted ATP-grasp superfamily ATP-dependent carboligase
MAARLIILGASARAAALSAIRKGFEPYAIDCYADSDLAAVCPAIKIECYPHDFPAALAAAPEAPWIYTGGLENYPRLVDQMATIRPLLGNRGAALRAVRDPARLAEAAQEAGLQFPECVRSLAANHNPADWLVKPRRGSGGLRIRFATAGDRERLPRNCYFQQFVAGQAASAVFVAAGGRASFLGASRQLLGRDIGIAQHPFVYAGSIGPLALEREEPEWLQNLGEVLARRCGLVGLFGVDFVRAARLLWILEVNPRYTASVEVLELASERNYLADHAAACLTGDVSTSPAFPPSRFAGKQIVFATSDVVVSAALDDLARQWNQPASPPRLADLPRIGDRFRTGQPVATVLSAGDSRSEVKSALTSRVAAVRAVLSREPDP